MKDAQELLCKTHRLHEKCYKIEDGIGKLNDGRVNPK